MMRRRLTDSGFLAQLIRCLIFGLWILGLSVCQLQATEDVIVRLEATPQDPWVGQKVVLLLDVLGKDGWAQLKKLGNTELNGGYLKRFESQGTRLSETIDGSDYSGQRYEYLFFPQQHGDLTIDSLNVDVEIKSWGAQAQTKNIRVATPSLVLNVKRPPGVQAVNGLISTAHFSATQNWQPTVEKLSLGDALTRTITLRADDVSGMAFAPLNQDAIDGIGSYPSSPTVEDHYSRGTLSGQRTEKITYVMEELGQHQIGDVEFTWWNIQSEKLETIVLPGMSPEVIGTHEQNSMSRGEGSSGPINRYIFTAVIVVALILIISVLIYLSRVQIQTFFQQRKKKRAESEKNYFRAVARASRGNDPGQMMGAVMRWLDRISNQSPARLDQFLEQYAPGSEQILDTFMQQFGSDNPAQSMKKFYELLVRARSQYFAYQRHKEKAEVLLPKIGLTDNL